MAGLVLRLMFKRLLFTSAVTLLISMCWSTPSLAVDDSSHRQPTQNVALADLTQLQEKQDTEIVVPDTNVFQGNPLKNAARNDITVDRSSSEARETSLPIYEWVSPGVHPKAVVILVHGLFQHGESLAPIASHLARSGYLAISIDQRGHGYWHFKNGVKKTGYSIDYSQSIEDVTTLARLLRKEHPSLPIFCLGESAGAAIAARSAAASPGLYDGLILCAFATKPRALRLLWTIEDVTANMFDWDRDLKMTRYVKRFTSEDNRVTLETMNDPMCRQGITLRELVHTCKFMKKTSRIAKYLSPNLPILMLEGENDQVLSPKSSSKFLARTKSEFKKLVMIPNCGHVLVSTTYIKPLVLSSIDDWLNQHSPGQFSTSAIVAKK